MSFIDELEKVEPPETLYHYTDTLGLIGILTEGKLRFTDIACVNDSSEYQYAESLFDEMLTQLKNDPNENERLRQYVSLTEEWARSYWVVNPPPSHRFIASFSGTPNDLGQWRGYGKTGSRYMITFRSAALVEAMRAAYGSPGASWFVQRVKYEKRQETIATIREAFREKHALFHIQNFGSTAPVSEEENSEWARHPQEHAWARGEFIWANTGMRKHPAFEPENEWRFIIAQPDSLKFRAGQSFVIPYAEITIIDRQSAIDSILVGPNPHPHVAEESVRTLLRETGWMSPDDENKLPVSSSDIPYRDW